MSGVIYILTNPCMPGLIKIGRTGCEGLETRIRDLSSSTSVPTRFDCYFAAEVEDPVRVENLLHQVFQERRINPRREFFEMVPEPAVKAISIGRYKEVTPGKESIEESKEEEYAFQKEVNRRSRFKFSLVGLKPGDKLTFVKDENIIATVIDDTAIEFESMITSLSAAASKILQETGHQWVSVQGPLYWMFENEVLTERRKRMEE